MNNEFFDALNILEQEKGINTVSLLEKISVAIENAVKKDFGEPENIIIDINPETRKFAVAIRKNVVEVVENPKAEITLDQALTYSKRAKIGGHVDIKIKTKDMGRIAAQSAKHIFRQGIKEEERLNTFKEYQSKVHELVSAKVVGIDEARGTVTIDMGKGEFVTILCSFAFAAHILVIDYFCQKVDGMTLSCAQFFFAGTVSIICMFIFEEPKISEITSAWLPLVYAGVGSCGIAFTAQIFGQKYTNPTVASVLLCLESVFSVIFGWLILGQSLDKRGYIGCVIMFIAVILTQLPQEWFDFKKGKSQETAK